MNLFYASYKENKRFFLTKKASQKRLKVLESYIGFQVHQQQKAFMLIQYNSNCFLL